MFKIGLLRAFKDLFLGGRKVNLKVVLLKHLDSLNYLIDLYVMRYTVCFRTFDCDRIKNQIRDVLITR